MNTSSRPFALNLYSFLQDVLSDFFGGQRLVQNMRFLFEPSSSSDAQALITLSIQKICVINLGSNWRTRRVTHKTIITMIVSWELARDGNLIPFIFYFTGLLISKRWTTECSDWLMLPTFAKIKLWQNPAHIFFAWIFAKFGPEVNGYIFAKLRNIGKIPPTLLLWNSK